MLKGQTPVGNNFTENLLESEEILIIYNNLSFLILVGRTNNFVKVKSSCYSCDLNCQESSIVCGKQFNSVNELYYFIVNIFKGKNIQINIKDNELNITLSFYNDIMKQNKQFTLTLRYQENNTDYFINYLYNKLIKLEAENNMIKMNYQSLFQNYQNLFKELDQVKSDILLLKNNNNMINFSGSIINNNNNNYLQNSINNMNMQMNMQMNNQINNENNTISILFREQDGSHQLQTLQNCNINETIGQLMNKYRAKINKPNFKFYLTYSARVLNPNLTLKQAGLSNLTTVNVMKGDAPI